jgi:hypothetical protein
MPATFRRVKQLVADFWANEKFCLSTILQHGNANEIISKFGAADQLCLRRPLATL